MKADKREIKVFRKLPSETSLVGGNGNEKERS